MRSPTKTFGDDRRIATPNTKVQTGKDRGIAIPKDKGANWEERRIAIPGEKGINPRPKKRDPRQKPSGMTEG